MSTQVVGGAVGKNEKSIIILCHRVVGTGIINKKVELLKLEELYKMNFLFRKSTAA